jgi:hypothetical protein
MEQIILQGLSIPGLIKLLVKLLKKNYYNLQKQKNRNPKRFI